MVTADQLIQTTQRFQRAIHIRHDLRDTAAIEQYVPTLSVANALATIVRQTGSRGTQRAHVLHAAYGSGKSHFAVALAALFENDSTIRPALRRFVDRVTDTDPHAGETAREYLASQMRLLPVVLSGNEGDLSTALLRALTRALHEAQLGDIRMATRFEAAVATILRWDEAYPDVLARLSELAEQQFALSIDNLLTALGNHNTDMFGLFEELYAQLTGGAELDPFAGQTPNVIFRDIARQIQNHGYTGLVVLWDEFGRYLDARASQAFGEEAALLQDFAETCNYSGEEQLHLLLFTHRELQGYAASLPKSYQQEWARIEGRFQRHNISTDPYIAFRLIDSAVHHSDENKVAEFLSPLLDDLRLWSEENHLFGLLDSRAIERLIHGTWPLHPLTVFALTHLSSRVAQNERTMFTFLTADEPHSLPSLSRTKALDASNDLFVRPAALWDYFKDAIRADVGGTGTHRHWSGVVHALDKIAHDDVLSTALVKTLGVLLVCAEFTPVKPDTDLLCWALGGDNAEQETAIVTSLENLRRRKVIIHRHNDGYWTFISGSDINFEERLAEVLQRMNPTPVQLRRLLQDQVPAPHTLARRYNQDRAMIRSFTGLYRWPSELDDAPWDIQLERSRADGLVVYVLVEDDVSWVQTLKTLTNHERVVYVFPDREHIPVSLSALLREIFGLQEISNDPSLKQHEDRARIRREIDWLLEDARARLEHTVATLTDPRAGTAIWVTVNKDVAEGYPVRSRAQASKIVSDICERVFSRTPQFNSEGLNVIKPSTQQLSAAQKVIDALFSNSHDETLGMVGRGPEILALNALLRSPGILQRRGPDDWGMGRPDNDMYMAELWDTLDDYVGACQVEGGIPVEPIIKTVMSPPYGIRPGVLPVLLSAVLRQHLKVTTVRKNGRALTPLDGALVIEMIFDPAPFTIEVGEWNETLEHLWRALEELFSSYIHENELAQQPLTKLRVSLLRWLQSLPPFCRETDRISPQAKAFRNLVRKAQLEPATALFQELPALLRLDETVAPTETSHRLTGLVEEINNAYLDLQRRLDLFAREEFGRGTLASDGQSAVQSWLEHTQDVSGKQITEYKFGSLITQDFIDAVVNARNGNGQFWNDASLAVLGVQLRDWNDSSEQRFHERVATAREEVEREVLELVHEESVVSVSLQLPRAEIRDYRFRYADLSTHGKHLLQNFKSTLEIAGRPLSMNEKRQIAVAFLSYVMGEDGDN